MAIPKGSNYAVIPLEEEWSNFSLENDDKHVLICGHDGETFNQFTGEPEKVILKVFEQGRDGKFNKILSEAYDDDFGKYLIIERENFD